MNYTKAADLSFLAQMEARGARYFDETGKEKPLLQIMREHDIDLIRLRLWNDPYSEEGASYGGGGCDPDTVLAMARAVSEAGMGVWLDFHYSDFWADPGKQTMPKAWRGLDAAELANAVEAFTREILERFRLERIDLRLVQIGNEITNGCLWPIGRIDWQEDLSRFPVLAELLKAGIGAVRDLWPKVPVMLHLDNGGNAALYRTWFDAWEREGVPVDVIGLSYYPFWHGSVAQLEENMRELAARYGKDLVIAETSTGFSLEDYAAWESKGADPLTQGQKERKGAAANEKLAAGIAFPMTPEGQAHFLQTLLELLDRIPDGRGKGLCWWEPAWTPVPGSDWAKQPGWEYVGEHGPGGNEWANQALFDYDGHALPALGVLRDHPRRWAE